MQVSTFDDERTGIGVIVRNAGIAIAAVLVLNLILYFVSDAAGWIPENLPESAEEFGLVSVVLYSIIPLVLGAALLAFLVKVTNHPVIMFSLIAAVVFIASLTAPLSIAGASNSFKLVLVAMHVITALVGTVLLLWNVADEPED